MFLRLLLSALLISFSSISQSAVSMGAHGWNVTPMDFSLWLSNTEVTLNDVKNDSEVTLSIDHIGMQLFDVSYDHIHYGATLGYANGSDNDQAVTQGVVLGGQYLGMIIRMPLFESDHLDVIASTQYLYQTMQGDSTTQRVQQSGSDLSASIATGLKLPSRSILWLNYTLGKLKLHQQASGVVNSNIDLERSAIHSYSAGFDLFTGNSGWVGLYLVSGDKQGIQIKFQRRFTY